MDRDTTNLFISIVLGAIGMAYTVYGRKNNFYFTLCGLTLMAFTFFSFDIVTLSVFGGFFVILPFILTRFMD